MGMVFRKERMRRKSSSGRAASRRFLGRPSIGGGRTAGGGRTDFARFLTISRGRHDGHPGSSSRSTQLRSRAGPPSVHKRTCTAPTRCTQQLAPAGAGDSDVRLPGRRLCRGFQVRRARLVVFACPGDCPGGRRERRSPAILTVAAAGLPRRAQRAHRTHRAHGARRGPPGRSGTEAASGRVHPGEAPGAHFSLSAAFAIPAFAHAASLSPPGAPLTATAPMVMSPTLIGTPP
jgi:hypothetical protein